MSYSFGRGLERLPMKDALENLASSGHKLIQRISDLLPASEPIDWSRTSAAVWRSKERFARLDDLDDIELDDLLEIDLQKERIETNTAQFIAGYPANNVLLWGARGTGKSSLIHALLNRYREQGLRLVEVDKRALGDIARIVGELRNEPYRFIIVCDDLSFERDDPSYKELKSALEGSVFRQSENVLIYATSNRRHLVSESMSDNLGARHQDGELHEDEAVEEKISLSDRFGLWLSFHPFRQDEYLEVVRHWLGRLAHEHGARCAWNDDARKAALQWALGRGTRSGRMAYYFARHWIGKSLLEDQPAPPS